MSTVTLDNKTILVTGAAGFIGSNLVKRIYQEAPSATVIGIDNMNAYYDVALKEFRLNELAKYPTFTFVKGNIADKELITELFEKYKPSVVVNLAAQAGVRYSITNPDAYVESNLVGFFNILEAMAFGVPCISSDCKTGPRSLIKSFENGLLFQTNNVEDLKDKMEWAIANPGQMAECGKQARRCLLEEYSSEKVLKKMQILLDYVKECE